MYGCVSPLQDSHRFKSRPGGSGSFSGSTFHSSIKGTRAKIKNKINDDDLVMTRSKKKKKICEGHVCKQNITCLSQRQTNNFLFSVEDILFRLLLEVYPTAVLPE